MFKTEEKVESENLITTQKATISLSKYDVRPASSYKHSNPISTYFNMKGSSFQGISIYESYGFFRRRLRFKYNKNQLRFDHFMWIIKVIKYCEI